MGFLNTECTGLHLLPPPLGQSLITFQGVGRNTNYRAMRLYAICGK